MPVSGSCRRCKARHIKCDEIRPSCNRCSESGVTCPGYFDERKFLDEGVKLRLKYGSPNHSASTTVGTKRIRGVVSTGSELQSPEPLASEKGESFVPVADDSNEPIPSTPSTTYVDHLYSQFHQSTSTAAPTRPVSDPGDPYRHGDGYAAFLGVPDWASPSTTPARSAGSSSLAGSTRGVSILRSPEDSYQLPSINGPSSGSSFTRPTSAETSPTYDIDDSVSGRVKSTPSEFYEPFTPQNPALRITPLGDEAHEISFLLRHFSEVIGPWMDLYDLGHYFASYIISNHPENPLLRYAAAAIAAKQLGRVNGRKGIVGGICNKQATMELYQEEPVDWYYTATKFYNKAIILLQEAFTPDEINDASLSMPMDDNERIKATLGTSKRRRVTFNRFSRTRTDRLLAATSILSVYEFLDASNREWSRHLNGIKSLLDEAEVDFMPRQLSQENLLSPTESMAPSSAQVASFWNFARCDYLAAYIHHGPTRLDTTDLPLWRSAGLLIDQEGFIIPTRIHKTFLCRPDEMREDMVSNALVWLISKIMNYISLELNSVGDENANHQESVAKWSRLEKELDVWYAGLCESFRPSCRLECEPGSSDPGRKLFPEVFFSISLCGASIQHYHFARILLLLYKPQEAFQVGISVSNRMRRFREISKQIDHHSREICGLALGRPPGFVRIHMLQPLFIAGQCLEGTAERKVILDLIRDIEIDTGWATEYRAKDLIAEWGW